MHKISLLSKPESHADAIAQSLAAFLGIMNKGKVAIVDPYSPVQDMLMMYANTTPNKRLLDTILATVDENMGGDSMVHYVKTKLDEHSGGLLDGETFAFIVLSTDDTQLNKFLSEHSFTEISVDKAEWVGKSPEEIALLIAASLLK